MNNDVIAEHVEAWIQSHAGVSGSTAPQAPAAPENESGKTLVVYYSATGSIEAVAGYIANATDGDTFAITPSEPYSSADLNWTDSESRVSREHDDPSLRAMDLAETTVNGWEDYDTVFIGYPIWWGNAAWPVDNFITANDFTGKTVIPFCTSTSSGLGQSGELLKEMAGTGNWQEGRRFSERVSQSDITAWIYLPYGYSADQQYNIFYLSHGGWSNEETLMGTPDNPHAFKHIVDHAIEDGKSSRSLSSCSPTITPANRTAAVIPWLCGLPVTFITNW